MAKKKIVSIVLSDDIKKLGKELAKVELRSFSNYIESLIKEKKKNAR